MSELKPLSFSWSYGTAFVFQGKEDSGSFTIEIEDDEVYRDVNIINEEIQELIDWLRKVQLKR